MINPVNSSLLKTNNDQNQTPSQSMGTTKNVNSLVLTWMKDVNEQTLETASVVVQETNPINNQETSSPDYLETTSLDDQETNPFHDQDVSEVVSNEGHCESEAGSEILEVIDYTNKANPD